MVGGDVLRKKIFDSFLEKIRPIPFQQGIILSTENHSGIFSECVALVKVAY